MKGKQLQFLLQERNNNDAISRVNHERIWIVKRQRKMCAIKILKILIRSGVKFYRIVKTKQIG